MLRWLRSTLHTADATARHDLAFFRTQPKFVAAIALFLVMPALYSAIYLSSLWDPAALTRNLTVVLVNEDEGAMVMGAPVNVGQGLLQALRHDNRFTYRAMGHTAEAIHEVDQGAAAFAVLIPKDFSRLAMRASQVGTARFVVHASEGNNSNGAAFAQRFAVEMSERLNQSINEQRFAAMLKMAGGSKTSLEELQRAVAQLNEGAAQVSEGSRRAREAGGKLAAGLAQLESGSSQLDQGARALESGGRQLSEGVSKATAALNTLHSRTPAEEELRRLREAARQLTSAQQSLNAALGELERGASRLRDGHDQLASEVGAVPFVGEALGEAALKLKAGAEQLRAGLQSAQVAGQRMSSGSDQTADAVAALTQGMTALAAGLAQLHEAMPAQAALDSFTASGTRVVAGSGRLAQANGESAAGSTELLRGLGKLDDGAARLREALQQLQASLPQAPAPPEGTPAGLSESVKPALQFSAPVPNQGTQLTPNFVPLSLWIGATLCAVLFAYHVLPSNLHGRGRLGIVLGKLTVPGLVVIGQALLLAALLHFVMDIRIAHPARFLITLLLTALSFAALLFALVRLLGNAGKLVAVMLLTLQLAASGTLVPVELTGRFFQALHPWLPLSWSIKAIRIAMFDAYEGAWLQSTLAMLALLAATIALAAWPKNWRVVPPAAYRPLLD